MANLVYRVLIGQKLFTRLGLQDRDNDLKVGV